MRALLAILLSLILQNPVRIPGPGGNSAGGGGSVSLDTGFNTTGHKYFAAGGLSSCANATTSCQITTSMNIPTSGDAVAIFIWTCTQSSCSTGGTTSNYTASDGTNTYALVSAASVIPGSGTQGVLTFVACNTTSGTYTMTISSAGADTFSFTFAEIVMFKNAHASGCADTNVSAQVNAGTGSSISVTSPGNVSKAGEIALAGFHCGGGGTTLTNTGTYTTLDSNVTDQSMVVDFVSPTNGATTTAAVTCSISAPNIGNLISIQP